MGTRLRPTLGGAVSLYKLWIKYAKRPVGVIVVDAGAAARLSESGSSLLAGGRGREHGDLRAG